MGGRDSERARGATVGSALEIVNAAEQTLIREAQRGTFPMGQQRYAPSLPIAFVGHTAMASSAIAISASPSGCLWK